MSSSSFNNSSLKFMSAGEVISRSWRLFRLNFKSIIIYSLIPTAIFAFAQVLVNLPSGYLQNPENAKNVPLLLSTCCIIYPIGFSLMLAGLLVAIFFNGCIIKAFYNKLTDQTLEFNQIIKEMKERISDFLKLCGILLIEMFVFMFIDLVLLIISYAIFFIPFIASMTTFKGNDGLMFVSCFISTVIFILFLFILCIIFCIQFLICTFQIIIVVIEKQPVIRSVVKSFDLLSQNILKTGWFVFCLFGMWYVLACYFNLPASIYVFYEMLKNGLASYTEPPLHVILIATLWGYFIGMFIWPLIIGSITMYYYDLRVRKDGLDLHLALISDKKNQQEKADN